MITHELVPEAIIAEPGRVVVLNGTSSSGKSKIAKELLDVLDGAWYHLPVDYLHSVRSRKTWSDEEFRPILQRSILGFQRMAAAGNNVVADYIHSERWRLVDALEAFEGVPVYLVGVRCSLAELERREAARGDRMVGMAALQFSTVHQPGVYDVEVDSERNGPRECALLIRDRLAAGRPATFERLRGQPMDF